MQKYVLTLMLIFSAGFATAQGWERLYGGGGSDVANGLALTPDGGQILAGYYGNAKLYLLKTDADGTEQWSKRYTDPAGNIAANAVAITHDSGYVAAGYVQGGQRDMYLMRTDKFGNRLWAKKYGNSNADYFEEAKDVIALPDGGFLMAGIFKNTATNEFQGIIVRTDAGGNQLWSKLYGQPNPYREGFYSATRAANGDILVAGDVESMTTDDKDVYVVRLNAGNGAVIWERSFNPFGGTADDLGYDIANGANDTYYIAGTTTGNGLIMKIDGAGTSTPLVSQAIPQTGLYSLAVGHNGDLFVAGYTETAVAELFIARLEVLPDTLPVLWTRTVGKGGSDGAYSVIASPDGGAVAAGFSEPFVGTFEQRVYLVKTDIFGTVFTSYLHGSVFRDGNSNCLQEAGEPNLRSWIVVAASQYDTTYAVTNSNGEFTIAVDTGTYNVRMYQTSNYWQPCTPVTVVHVPELYDTVSFAIPIQPAKMCPRNEIDIATPILRRCTDNEYVVRYCNTGPANSDGTKIWVTLDPSLSITSSTVPYTTSGDTLWFDIGLLPSGECNTFTFKAFLDCNETVTGQAHCVTAYITPDSICNVSANWDHSVLTAEAKCVNDSVKMYLRNTGMGPLTTSVEFVIAEDVIVLYQGSGGVNLQPGNATEVWSHDADGGTYRIVAQQSPGYPGESFPTAAIEGCISDTSTSQVSYGFYTMFPEQDQDPFIAIHCQESEESTYTPVELKRGHPKGFDVQHYVSPQTDLDFLIQFRNTTNDTVQEIIVRDTLSAYLDPATVFPGAASHPYEFQVYGGGIVEFRLADANLLSGSSASEGFVKFRVAQKPNLPCGTQILNSAAIYFDNFNAPIYTNTTLHTICNDSVWLVATRDIVWEGAEVKVYPNPFENSATVEVTGVQANQFACSLYDNQGRLLFNQFSDSSNFQLFRRQLPAGVYYYRLTAQGKPVATGKIIAK